MRKYFKDENDVRQLLSLHSFSSIWGPRLINDIMSDGDTAVALSNLRFVLMHPHNGRVVAGMGRYGFFRTIDEMLEQDLNYVYIFGYYSQIKFRLNSWEKMSNFVIIRLLENDFLYIVYRKK